MINQFKLHKLANSLGLLIILAVLLFVFIDQYVHHDLPCPLCLLQRVAFIGIALCFCLNLKDGIKPAHYGLMIFSAIFGFAVSLRQVLLHYAPGSSGYGRLFLGLYYYTWSAIVFAVVMGLIGVALLMQQGFVAKPQPQKGWMRGLMVFLLLLILANAISTFLECGIKACPDNPTQYEMLSRDQILMQQCAQFSLK